MRSLFAALTLFAVVGGGFALLREGEGGPATDSGAATVAPASETAVAPERTPEPALDEPDDGEPFVFVAGTAEDLPDEEVLSEDEPPFATVEGRVTWDGGALEGATVSFVRDDGEGPTLDWTRVEAPADGEERPWTELFTTGGEGEYSVQLEAGSYRVVARFPDKPPAVIEGFVVAPGEEVRGVDLEIDDGLTVLALVTREDGESASGVEVELEGQGFRRIGEVDSEDGKVEFPGLPKGSYRVRALAPGVGVAEGSAEAGGAPVALSLARGETFTLQVAKEEGGPAVGARVLVSESLPSFSEEVDPWGTPSGEPFDRATHEGVTNGCDAPGHRCLVGVTDERGELTVKVSRGAKAVIAVETGLEWAHPQRGVLAWSPGEGAAFVRLRQTKPVSLTFTDTRTGPQRNALSFRPDDERYGFLALHASPKDGAVSFVPWPGLPGAVTLETGQSLEGELPPGWKLQQRTRGRGCSRSVQLITIKQPAPLDPQILY